MDSPAAGILLVLGGLLLLSIVRICHTQDGRKEVRKPIGELGWIGDRYLEIGGESVVVTLGVSLVLGIDRYVQFLRGDFAKFRADLG